MTLANLLMPITEEKTIVVPKVIVCHYGEKSIKQNLIFNAFKMRRHKNELRHTRFWFNSLTLNQKRVSFFKQEWRWACFRITTEICKGCSQNDGREKFYIDNGDTERQHTLYINVEMKMIRHNNKMKCDLHWGIMIDHECTKVVESWFLFAIPFGCFSTPPSFSKNETRYVNPTIKTRGWVYSCATMCSFWISKPFPCLD